jgi:IS30 family transposase
MINVRIVTLKIIFRITTLTLVTCITADNGKEFAKNTKIAKELEISFYFCMLYYSWKFGVNIYQVIHSLRNRFIRITDNLHLNLRIS